MPLNVPTDIGGRAKSTLQRWRENPVEMIRDEFNAEPDAWQADALMAFANPSIERW